MKKILLLLIILASLNIFGESTKVSKGQVTDNYKILSKQVNQDKQKDIYIIVKDTKDGFWDLDINSILTLLIGTGMLWYAIKQNKTNQTQIETAYKNNIEQIEAAYKNSKEQIFAQIVYKDKENKITKIEDFTCQLFVMLDIIRTEESYKEIDEKKIKSLIEKIKEIEYYFEIFFDNEKETKKIIYSIEKILRTITDELNNKNDYNWEEYIQTKNDLIKQILGFINTEKGYLEKLLKSRDDIIS